MFDVVLETVRAVVMLGVIVFLANAGRNRHTSSQMGWSLITVGFLRGFKLGKEWRISPEDLYSFIEQHANKPPKTAHG